VLVTELTVDEPGQQARLQDRDVPPGPGPYHLPIPVRRCPGAADHQDPVMTSYLPLTCLAATLARCGCPGAAADPERLRLRRRHRRLRGPARLVARRTRDGSVLGLAERLTTSIQTCWPFIIAVALRRTQHPRPGLAARGREQDR